MMETGEPKFRCPLCGGEMEFHMRSSGLLWDIIPRMGYECTECGYRTV